MFFFFLQVRVQCFHYLRTKTKPRGNSFIDKEDSSEPDAQVLKLTKVLQEMDDAFSSTLHPRKTRVSVFPLISLYIINCLLFQYIFEGLAHLASRILIQASNYLEDIDQLNIQRMCRNSLALQQTLSSITASREVALDQAKNFYELLCMEPDVRIASICKGKFPKTSLITGNSDEYRGEGKPIHRNAIFKCLTVIVEV